MKEHYEMVDLQSCRYWSGETCTLDTPLCTPGGGPLERSGFFCCKKCHKSFCWLCFMHGDVAVKDEHANVIGCVKCCEK